MLGPGEWDHEEGVSTCSKICSITGERYSVSISTEQYHQWKYGQNFLRDVCPDLDAKDREFLISGNTPAMWEDMFNNLEDVD